MRTTRSERQELYWQGIRREAPRVLSMIDREPYSATRGSADRTYWAWKFVDFSGSRFQEIACLLAFLYTTDEADNPYRENELVRDSLSAVLDFWARLQHADGSFDEAYPFERSVAATAFTTFYISEALGLMGDALDAGVRSRTVATIGRAGTWLARNDEDHGVLSNHLAAAAAACYHAYRLTGDGAFERRSQHFLGRILKRQSSEGWYEEYGGADPGYQTHGTFYLARLHQLSDDGGLAASLHRATSFLTHCIHPDGSIGGEYASRNTKTYYPAGFEMLAPFDDGAAWIVERMAPSVTSGAAAGLSAIDRYNYYPFMNNYAFAYLACRQHRDDVVRSGAGPAAGSAHFPGAGISRIVRPGYEAMVSERKGGVVQVFSTRQQRLVLSDCGYIGRTRQGKRVSTQHDDRSRAGHWEGDAVTVEGPLAVVPDTQMAPWRFVAFRSFMLTVGRLPSLALWVKRLLVRVLIDRRPAVPLRHTRRIEFGDDYVEIRDEFRGDASPIAELVRSDQFTTIHMGSSRYHIGNDLIAGAASPDPVTAEELSGRHVRVRRVNLAGT